MKGLILTLTIILGCLNFGVVQSFDAPKDAIALEDSEVSIVLSGTKLLAELGHAESQFRLGKMYENGHGTQQDIEIALRWYSRAAQQGYTDAQVKLGNLYLNEIIADGLNHTPNLKAADRWFTKAVDQGDADSIFEIGEIFQWGVAHGDEIANPYFKMAIEQYTPAAEKGVADAQFKLGYLYDHGFGDIRDADVAMKWYSLAAQQGHSDALFYLSELCQDSKDELTVECEMSPIELLTLAAEQGSAQAQYDLGSMSITKPEILSEEFASGVKWLVLAAEQGDMPAQLRLGELYENGNGVPQNVSEAAKWYKLAAEQGDMPAQLKLGELYENGNGVPQNISEAAKWYTLVAKQNDDNAFNALYSLATRTKSADAQYGMGEVCNELFDEDLRDCKVPGMQWIILAAVQGHADAQLELGLETIFLGRWVPSVQWTATGADSEWEETMLYLMDSSRKVGIDYEFGNSFLLNVGMEWLELAAQQGHTEAQYEFVSFYKWRHITSPGALDFEIVAKYLASAAERGDAYAQFELGRMLEQGEGISQDIEVAMKLYMLAADRGHTEAILRLGELYELGIGFKNAHR